MTAFAPARKQQLKARVALAGPTGSGKTWTALVWAQVIGKRIALVDTEHSSASYYADHFTFDTANWTGDYDPRELAKLIQQTAASGEYDVLIVDSLSHFWEGEGGTLDIADAAGKRAQGNSFAGWKVATPAIRHLIDVIRSAPIHVIVTMRSKMEYVQERDDRTGKNTVRKVGMAPIMRAGVEYEFTVVGDLDLEHHLTISKSRCHDIADQVAAPGRADELARTFAAWLDSGDQMAGLADVEAIRDLIDSVHDDDQRNGLKRAFKAAYGLPDALTAAKVPEAVAWITERLPAPLPSTEGTEP